MQAAQLIQRRSSRKLCCCNHCTNAMEEVVTLIKSRRVFVEQQCLKGDWNQTARWLQYEETVEGGSNKWSKPYFSVICVPALSILQDSIQGGFMISEVNCSSFYDLVDCVVGAVQKSKKFSEIEVQVVRDTLLLKHFHQTDNSAMSNERFGKKLPDRLDGVCILTGENQRLTAPICALVRVRKPIFMTQLTEVKVPTKFVLIYLTNHESVVYSDEIGRAFGVLMTDEAFVRACYELNLKDIPHEIERCKRKWYFLPSSWEPSIRLEPSILQEKVIEPPTIEQQLEDNCKFREDYGLERSGFIFGGLFGDIKRKAQFYLSDFRGLFSSQVISCTLFMYFACLTALITFGGLLAKGKH